MPKPVLRVLGYVITAVLLLGLAAAGVLCAPGLTARWFGAQRPAASDEHAKSSTKVVADQPETIRLPADVVERLGIQTALVQYAQHGKPLELPGSLTLDADRLSHVRARFGGEVVQIGTNAKTSKPVTVGDAVQKDDLLAIIWSRELGEKKSELVDALSQLRLDEDTLTKLDQAFVLGAIPERSLREAERKVEADRVAEDRAARTLRAWRIGLEEIDGLRAEASQLSTKDRQSREDLVSQWAKVEVRAPLTGVVLERNVTLGDLVDTTLDMFKIADLSRLRVVAHAYEEDLPALDALPDEQRAWQVRVGPNPASDYREGEFEHVGYLIDPNQHTALVMGWVNNPKGRLRAGQFVTTVIELPPTRDEVLIPLTAVLEKGKRSIVFVQPDEQAPQYQRLQVAVARRTPTGVFIRNNVSPEERQSGVQPLQADLRVVSSGIVELDAVLSNSPKTNSATP